MHIAAALNRPLVTMFGPTNPIRTGPWNRQESVVRVDIPCSPCYSRHCSHTSCMKWLPTSAVLDVAEQQLRKRSRPFPDAPFTSINEASRRRFAVWSASADRLFPREHQCFGPARVRV
jgi:hypothetical protein